MFVRTRTVILLMLSIYAVTLGLFFVASVRTVTFFPIAQSYSWQIVPLANNGGSDNFEITSWHDQHNMRGWIAFNISSVPQNVWVQSATLRLRLWQKTTNQTEIGDPTGRIYAVYMLTQTWSGTGVNWVNQPSWTDYHSASSPVPPGQGGWSGPLIWMDWDLTSMVRDWHSGVPNYGVVVKDTRENATLLYSTQFFTFHQTPNESYFPRLMITYLNPVGLYAALAVVFTETVFFIFFWMRSQSTKQGTK